MSPGKAERRRARQLLLVLRATACSGLGAACLVLGGILRELTPAPTAAAGPALALVAGLCLAAGGGAGALLAGRWAAAMSAALDRRARMAADLTHDLRAPVARLHTRAQLLLRRGGDLPESVVTELRRLVEGTRELADVVDDVLASTDLRPATADPEPLDLVDLVAEVVAAEEPRLCERDVHAHLEVEGPDRLPVDGVRTALKRAFSALTDNALAHTPAGGHVNVTVSVDTGARFAKVCVRDDGVGLDPRCCRQVFSRSVHGSSGSGRRHGIGLALVREIVESHGGTVCAHGRPGAGATFVVRLPLARGGPSGVSASAAGCSRRRTRA